MKKFILIGLFGITLAGCGSSPVPNEKAVSVPAKRIYNQEIFTKKDNSGMVIIKRDAGIIGSLCSDAFFVDGIKIADLRTSEKIVIYPRLGKRIFSVKANGVCESGMSEIESDIEENQILTYRISHTGGGYAIYRTIF